MDAAHFVLAPFLGCLWCATRLFVRGQSGRQRHNVLGAIEPLTGRFFRICNTTYINSQSVCELLRQIAEANFSTPVTIVLDNARYQRCRLVEELAKQLGIELLFLPSYSPNLNVIERLWKFVKKEVLNSRYLGKFDQFQNSIESCLDSLSDSRQAAIKQMLTLRFQRFDEIDFLANDAVLPTT
jgi:transposase